MAEGLGNYWGPRIVHPYRYLDGLADDGSGPGNGRYGPGGETDSAPGRI